MSAPIDLQLREYTAYFESELPVIDVEDVLTERIGAAAVRPIRPRRPQRRRRWLVAVAAAAAVLVLVGGVAWLTGRTADVPPATTPVPTTSVSTTTPTTPTTGVTTTAAPPTTQADPPAPVTAGDASLTWESVEGAPAGAFGPFFDTGFAVGTVVRNGPFDHTVWTSNDLRSWTESDLPVSTLFFDASIVSTTSGRWLIGSGPTGLWFSPAGDPGEWQEVDVSGLARAAPDGLIFQPMVGRPARIDDVNLVPVEHVLGIDWERIFGVEPGTYPVVTLHQEDEFTDVLVVTGRSAQGSVTLGRVTPRETGEGLFLVDESTGDELFFYPRGIEGIDQDMSAELVNGVRSSSLYAITDTGARELDVFQTAGGGQPRPWVVQVVEYGGQVIAIGAGDGGIESFISPDGVDWQSHSAPPFYGDVIVDEASGLLYSSPLGMFSTHWVSADAVTWSTLDVAEDRFSLLRRLTSGWLVLPVEDEGTLAGVGFFIVGDDQSEITVGDAAGATVDSAVAVGDTILLIGPGSAWLGQLRFQP